MLKSTTDRFGGAHPDFTVNKDRKVLKKKSGAGEREGNYRLEVRRGAGKA